MILPNTTKAQKHEGRYAFQIGKMSLVAVADSGYMSGLYGLRLAILYKGKEICKRITASTAIPVDAPQPVDVIREKYGKPDYVGSPDKIEGHQMAMWFGKNTGEKIHLSIAREKNLAVIVWEDIDFLKKNLKECKSCFDVFKIPDDEGNRRLREREAKKAK